MVEGQLNNSTSTSRVVAVDLDGTLIAGNSLRIYITEALRDMWLRKPLTALKIVGLILLRKLRLITHRKMKFDVLKCIEPTQQLRKRFTAQINLKRRQSVSEILDGYRRMGCTILLATAAPDIYISWIWNESYVATPTANNPNRHECRATNKANAVRSFLGPNHHLEAVLTDHYDDLELLAAKAVTNYLVAPDARTYNAVRLAGIPFKLVKN